MLNDMRFPLAYGPNAMIREGILNVYWGNSGQTAESFSTDTVEISMMITISGASWGENCAFH
jgi:hypothetical protein